MKICLILVASLFFSACGEMPKFPDIKYHYAIFIKEIPVPDALSEKIENFNDIYLDSRKMHQVNCLMFEVISKYPFKIKYIDPVTLDNCQGVGGYRPQDTQKLINWIDDMQNWANGKKCLK